MVNGFCFRQSRRKWCVGLASILLPLLIGSPCLAQGQLNSGTLAHLNSRLAEQYPAVRSVVFARHGCVEFEYYRGAVNAQSLLPVHSITKSVLSILIGMALDKGYLRVDKTLSELLPEALTPTMDPRVRDITVLDLLTMTSGFDSGAPFGAKIAAPPREMWEWTLYRPIQYKPGTQFHYDDDSVNLLSVVLARSLQQDSKSFVEQNLFGPLEITNYDWRADGEGHLIGATTLSLTARDMVKLGQLYLQRGRWGDEQIVSSEYVAASTTKHNDGGPPVRAAYGYLWWVTRTSTGLDAFFAAGTGSQIIYVVPELDLVLAVASLASIPGGSMRFVNDLLLPAIAREPVSPTCVGHLKLDKSSH